MSSISILELTETDLKKIHGHIPISQAEFEALSTALRVHKYNNLLQTLKAYKIIFHPEESVHAEPDYSEWYEKHPEWTLRIFGKKYCSKTMFLEITAP